MRDEALAKLCADAYLPDPTVAIGDDLACTVTEAEDATIVAFRGTANPRGWMRDLRALTKSHPMIGICHRGFLSGACELMQRLTIPADRKVILTGHSLGGGLAVVLGALRIATAERVDQLVTFGAPRSGLQRLADIWAPIDSVRLYRNGNDPVPGVPLTLLAFPYMHIRGLRQVGSPDPAEPWNCHSIRQYEAVVGDLPNNGGA